MIYLLNQHIVDLDKYNSDRFYITEVIDLYKYSDHYYEANVLSFDRVTKDYFSEFIDINLDEEQHLLLWYRG